MGFKMRTCNICGKMFEANGTRVYCSQTCSKKGKANSNRVYKKENFTIGKARKTYTKPKLSIAQVCKLAKAEGISYGKYVGKYGL